MKYGAGVNVIATKSGASYTAVVVVATGTSLSSGVSSDELLYLSGSTNTKSGDYWESKVYFMDGTNETVLIDRKGGEGFYTFSVNSDDAYELDATTSSDYVGVSGTNYKDESGIIPDTTIASVNERLGYISFDTPSAAEFAGKTLNDIGLSDDLQIIDTRGSSNIENSPYYDRTIDSAARLEAAMENANVIVTAYVDDGEVLLIGVTDVTLGTVSAGSIMDELESEDEATISDGAVVTDEVVVGSGQTLIVEDGTLEDVVLGEGATLKLTDPDAEVTITECDEGAEPIETTWGATIIFECEQTVPVVIEYDQNTQDGVSGKTGSWSAFRNGLENALADMFPNGGQVDLSEITDLADEEKGQYNRSWGMINLVVPASNKNYVVALYDEDEATLLALTWKIPEKYKVIGLTTTPMTTTPGSWEWINHAESDYFEAGAEATEATLENGVYKYVVYESTTSEEDWEAADDSASALEAKLTGKVLLSGYFTVGSED